MIELLPKIQKTKIYDLKEVSSNDYFNSLNDKLVKIRDSKTYKSIKNKIKNGNEKEKKNKEEEKLSNSKILLLHLAIYEDIYNELQSKKNKSKNIPLIEDNIINKLNELTLEKLPAECYYMYIKLMYFIIQYFKIEYSIDYKEQMFKILLNESFFDYEIKIEVITYLIENDNDYSYKCLSNELLLNLMNIVFYIILPVKLKDQNQNLLDFIKYCINNENIFILPYTIEFLIDMIFYHLLTDKISKDISNISNFNKFIRYFSEIIRIIKTNKKLFLSKFLIGKIIFLLFLFRNQIQKRKKEIFENEKLEKTEKKKKEKIIKKKK